MFLKFIFLFNFMEIIIFLRVKKINRKLIVINNNFADLSRKGVSLVFIQKNRIKECKNKKLLKIL